LLTLRVGRGNDWGLLTLAARRLTGDRGLHVYADTPGLQIGAPALLLVRGLDAIGSLALVHVLLALSFVVVIWLGERTATALGHRPRPWLTFVTGLLAAVGWTSLAGDWLHVEDAIALICLGAAALFAVSSRSVPAAAMVGLAIGIKPWAVVGLPLLLLTPRRDLVHAAGAVVVVPASFWLPFLIADSRTARITHIPFPVAPTTPVHLLHLASGLAPPWIRTAQLGFAVALAAVVCARNRERVGDAIAAGVVGRLLLDVADYRYYWAGLVLAAAFADVSRDRLPARTLIALGGWCLPIVGVGGDALAGARLVVLVVLGASYLPGLSRFVHDPTATSSRNPGATVSERS
jgi:hypothetical protein